MRYREIMEGKWWDNEPTITLFHGTSSAFLDSIKTNGLSPPSEDLRAYAYKILAQYIPKEKWKPKLLKMVDEHAARIGSIGRSGDRGAVLYFFTELSASKGYARSYAQHGGEIAADVYNCASIFLKPNYSVMDLIENPPIKPRFLDAKPIVIEVEVPKSWCLMDVNIEELKNRAKIAWDNDERWTKKYKSLEDLFKGMFDRREIRVARTIPPEMITKIHYSDKLSENVISAI
jgi:hypothetical protein